MRGLTIKRNVNGDRGSPWRVNLRTWTRRVLPRGVLKMVCAPFLRLVTIQMKSSRMPRNTSVRANCAWSVEGKIWVTSSRYAMRMPCCLCGHLLCTYFNV
jgi:hypothetical protein